MHEQTNKTPAAGDEFAAIAEHAFADRSELLEEPQPYDGPWEELPLERGADARFESPPSRAMATPSSKRIWSPCGSASCPSCVGWPRTYRSAGSGSS